jgi:hypothetical protein
MRGFRVTMAKALEGTGRAGVKIFCADVTRGDGWLVMSWQPTQKEM